MDWDPTQIYKASFKGVEFDAVLSASTRRAKRYRSVQYPNRPGGTVWDGARKPVTIEITAFFQGPGFKQRLQSLVKACDQIGPGTLVHPIYGEIWCLCTDYNDDGRGDPPDHLSLSLQFIEVSQDANAWHTVIQVLSPGARAESLATDMDTALGYSGDESFTFYSSAFMDVLGGAELTVQGMETALAAATQGVIALSDGVDVTTTPLYYDFVADAHRLASLLIEAADLQAGGLATLKTYLVQREMTLLDVAAECGCTPEDIEMYNVIGDPLRIVAPVILLVPA